MAPSEGLAPTEHHQLTDVSATVMTASAPSGLPVDGQDDYDVPLGVFLARPRYVTRVAWSYVDAFALRIANLSILEDLLGNTSVSTKLAGFAAFRATVHVRLQCNGSPHFFGRLAVGWVPVGGNSTDLTDGRNTVPIDHPSQLLQLAASCQIDPSARDTCELVLPFVSRNGSYSTDTGSAEDTLKFCVLNPLRATNGDAAPVAQISVFAWLTDVELLQPTYQSEMSGATGNASGARLVRGFASAFARKKADDVLTSMGLGQPASTQPVTPTFNMDVLKTACDGLAIATSLSGHTKVEEPIGMGPSGDEMSFKSIYSREGWISRIQWAPGVPANLAYFPVQPVFAVDSPTIATQQAYLFTPAGYLALPFKYWRGTCTYTLRVVANKFCTGTIRMRHVPRALAAPSFLNDAGDVLSASLDITAGHELKLTVPFCASTPWLANPVAGFTTCAAGITNGQLVVDYVDALNANGATIELNLFVSWDDLELTGFGQNDLTTNAHPYYAAPSDDPTYQGAETFSSVRELVKLPRPAGMAVVSATAFAYTIYLPDDVLHETRPADTPVWEDTAYTTPLAYFCALYLIRTGGLRYTFETDLSIDNTNDSKTMVAVKRMDLAVNTANATTTITNYLVGTNASYGYRAVASEGVNVLTVDSPFTGPQLWAGARSLMGAQRSKGDSIVLYITLGNTVAASGYVTVHQSGADDIDLSYFLCVPYLIMAIL